MSPSSCMACIACGEPHRVLSLEVVAPIPLHLREHLLQVLAQLTHLPLQVHVAHQLIAELLQLRPLLGGHRVHHRLHGGHPLRHLLQQLLDVLGILREEVAELLHELGELLGGVLASLMLLEQLVQRRHHVLHAGHVLGGHVLHRPRHLVDHLLHQLLFQLLHQLLEPLLRLGRLEVVRIQLADLAGEVVGHQVEAHVAILRGRLRILGPTLVARVLRIAQRVLDRVTFLVEDVVDLVVDLVVHAAEIAVGESLLALAAQLLEQLAQPLEVVSVAVLHPLLHHPAQCRVDVTVVQQLIGQLVECRVGVELEPRLCAVPGRIGEPGAHGSNLHQRSQARPSANELCVNEIRLKWIPLQTE